jgi:hypothetical protein
MPTCASIDGDQKTSRFFEESMAGHMGVDEVY